MSKYINRNFFWADLFVNQLSLHGLRHVCISPGSRNTPLTIAFAQNRAFKKYIVVDERSSGFFALGLSKYTSKPVAIVTTSGTAVAELYPAIIEAYFQRISLVICTADRPLFLRNTGANQTINQANIFSNHIRYFKDFGLPSLSKTKLKKFASDITKGLGIGQIINKGPIHLNFPFKKPLEPNTFSDLIDLNIDNYLVKKDFKTTKQAITGIKRLQFELEKSERPLIHCGWGNFDNDFYNKLLNFSLITKIPILADGATRIRFLNKSNSQIIATHSAFLSKIPKDSDFIIHFGNAPTSAAMLNYFDKTKAQRFLINKFGDVKDPSKKKGFLLISDSTDLIESLSSLHPSKKWEEWSKELIEFDKIAESVKSIITRSKFGNESRIITELLNQLPNSSNIFISNSMPIRDFDYFGTKIKRNFKIFVNRGASGIDGIISTASGIGVESKKKTFLIIGDLAFYHNMSALSTLNEYKIPLKIILINNSGGNIFRMLPVSKEIKYFEKYFISPQKLNYKKIVNAFNGKYYLVNSWKGFRSIFEEFSNEESFSLIEFKTDARKSTNLRYEYWSQVKNKIESLNANHIK